MLKCAWGDVGWLWCNQLFLILKRCNDWKGNETICNNVIFAFMVVCICCNYKVLLFFHREHKHLHRLFLIRALDIVHDLPRKSFKPECHVGCAISVPSRKKICAYCIESESDYFFSIILERMILEMAKVYIYSFLCYTLLFKNNPKFYNKDITRFFFSIGLTHFLKQKLHTKINMGKHPNHLAVIHNQI